MFATCLESSETLLFPLSFSVLTFTFGTCLDASHWELSILAHFAALRSVFLYSEEVAFPQASWVLCRTLLDFKEKPQYSVNTISLTFLFQQSDVEVSPETPKPITFSISKLTDIFSFLPCILPQQPP